MDSLAKTLKRLNENIAALTQERNAALRALRNACQHAYLVESTGSGKPWRICVDCGAEEEGWYCGYHVLILSGEYLAPRLGARPGGAIVSQTSEWMKYRKDGPLYRVGQSHANFAGGGHKTYEQLTAQ